jgi:hypothetical protein
MVLYLTFVSKRQHSWSEVHDEVERELAGNKTGGTVVARTEWGEKLRKVRILHEVKWCATLDLTLAREIHTWSPSLARRQAALTRGLAYLGTTSVLHCQSSRVQTPDRWSKESGPCDAATYLVSMYVYLLTANVFMTVYWGIYGHPRYSYVYLPTANVFMTVYWGIYEHPRYSGNSNDPGPGLG